MLYIRGFDFVGIPIAYTWYLNIVDQKNTTPEDVCKVNPATVNEIDALVAMAHKYNMHLSLNLHRAPGYCIYCMVY
jgi:endoglucanase